MSLLIEKTHPLCQLQDAGRFGVRHLGITQGGAADWLSMSHANLLLGNAPSAGVLEIPLGGFALLAQADCLLALAGADLQATVDGAALLPWRSFNLRRGQRLVFGSPREGLRAYLAAPGGFSAPAALGSLATVARDSLGGLHGDGRPLAIGDRLGFLGAPGLGRETATARPPDLSLARPLELVLGAQVGQFSGQSLFEAFNQPWTLDTRADRMGMRLLGPVLAHQGPGLVSEGITLGAVQVPPDGQPIVLGNDRQTIGGYPRLGALTPLSMARLAQAMPGQQLRLRPVMAEAARDAHLEAWRALVG
ncbi:biotin-dependent carboxyltransferase family protein [Pseudomonas sp. DC3000-4b1]|uniref:5-oxoprolinase subunit C family protein n=1 Tax=unclassified Pseudomonas TaxID=196821 RepID=UPI003CE7139D